MPIADFTHALVRAVPRRYGAAYAPRSIHIDLALADAQHARYARALEAAGVVVNRVVADEAYYDCVFIEDTAIVWRDHALVTRMTRHREGEQHGVAAALEASHALVYLSAGSQLEGGDVLHTEHVTYVGLTARTNERGASELAEFLGQFGRQVVAVPVTDTLHLKSVVTCPGSGALLVAPGHVPLARFEADSIIETGAGEEGGANCLRVRDTLLAPAAYPETLGRLAQFAERQSIQFVPLDLSEFAKGDGSATCLSLLWREKT